MTDRAPEPAAAGSAADSGNGVHGRDEPIQPPPSADKPKSPAEAAPEPTPTMPTTPSKPEPGADTWAEECEHRLLVRAHGRVAPNDSSKFELAPGAEFTAAFYFRPSWDGSQAVQLLKSRELIDNRQVVHHWMLYTSERSMLEEGAFAGDPDDDLAAAALSDKYLLGGVPGATDLELPKDVGLRLPSSPSLAFRLNIHYFNAGDTAQLDATGVEICVTSKKRPIEAAAHWLGTTSFNLPPREKTDIVTTCRPNRMTGPAHILAFTPHMHRRGVHSKAVIQRTSGEAFVLHDAPYQFSEQRLYAPPDGELLVNPGETVTVTCSFLNETERRLGFGDSTEDEMCFFTLWAWPAGSLHNNSLAGPLLSIPQDQTCL